MSCSVKELLASPPASTASFLQQQREQYPERRELLDEIEALHSKKLHHQFTNQIELYLSLDAKTGEELAAILYHLVFPIRQKLSPVRIVELIRHTVSKLCPIDGLLMIDEFEPSMADEIDSVQRLHIVKANTLIRLGDLGGASELLLTQLAKQLDSQIGVDIAINAAYHEACANYYRASDNPRLFYESALLFLAYTPLNSLPLGEQQSLAFELSVAGLVADGMLDFGELLALPILTTLTVPNNWIVAFVRAATEGCLTLFDKAMEQYAAEATAAFGHRMSELRLKMKLSSLVDLTFKLPTHERHLSVEVIATHCKISNDQCERLLMKAMSLGLLRGRLNGIENQFTVDWVKPRIVDSQRVDLIRDRFVNWKASVKQLAHQLENSMPELLAA